MLVGASYGGYVAQQVATALPDQVELLMLVCTAGDLVEPDDGLRAFWQEEGRFLAAGDVDDRELQVSFEVLAMPVTMIVALTISTSLATRLEPSLYGCRGRTWSSSTGWDTSWPPNARTTVGGYCSAPSPTDVSVSGSARPATYRPRTRARTRTVSQPLDARAS
ncbi:MAG: hypothetical protein JWR90_2284, partial [Marmoricola sp.]|nr:hypothetical protein [Marmoricola sp.]